MWPKIWSFEKVIGSVNYCTHRPLQVFWTEKRPVSISWNYSQFMYHSQIYEQNKNSKQTLLSAFDIRRNIFTSFIISLFCGQFYMFSGKHKRVRKISCQKHPAQFSFNLSFLQVNSWKRNAIWSYGSFYTNESTVLISNESSKGTVARTFI